MSNMTLIQNGRVVDPKNNFDSNANILIKNKKIEVVSKREINVPEQTKKIDATGLYVFPGIIDFCARMREPGEEKKANMDSETMAAIGGGITRIICPPDTHPVIDTPAMVHMIQDRAREFKRTRIHPLGAITTKLHGKALTDMAMLMQAGCVGVSNAKVPIVNTLLMRRAMQYASTFSLPIFLTPQDHWLQGNGCVHEGKISTLLGLPAIPNAAEVVGVARDLALIETLGGKGHAHFDMLSCSRSVNMLQEAHTRDIPVSAGVSIHHLLHCDEDIGYFNSQYKTIPPFRTKEDRDALIDGVRTQHIQVICSDHQPHDLDAKLMPFSIAAAGISTLDLLITLTMKLVNKNKMSLLEAIKALTYNPARIVKIDSGHFDPGAPADICVFSPQLKWNVNESTILSRGINTPYLGQNVTGRTVATFIDGELCFQHNVFKNQTNKT